MDQLPIFLNLAGRPVLLAGDGEAADAKARLIEAAGGRIVRTPEPDVRIAFVAIEDEAAAAETADRLRVAGLLVNVVDRPALCDFTIPAIVDRSPVIVAVGTGGASATLAKALRERFEAMLPGSLARLAILIRAARTSVARRYPEPAARRRFWDALLAPGGPLDPFADIADPQAGIDAGADIDPAPSVTRIRARHPDELTLRELRALSTADTLFHSKDAASAVLDRARRDARRVVCAAPPSDLPPGRSVFVAA